MFTVSIKLQTTKTNKEESTIPNKEMWSEEMIAEQIKRTSVEQKSENVPEVSATDTIPDSNKRRNFLVVGCGDG